MSNCSAAYYTSLKGRIATAWNILRHGHYMQDMSFDNRQEVEAFTKHLLEMADEVFSGKEQIS